MTSQSLTITRLSVADSEFENQLLRLLQREMLIADDVTEIVTAILKDVRARGDQAVLEYTRKFDDFDAASIQDLSVSREQMLASLENLADPQRQALEHAAQRIGSYHERQKQGSRHYEEADGSI